ncbi:MAG: peptidoglycan endopeptidase, partial [Mycobacterium sp.]|nr:peptidoglycan endopeptidase [Mycobacterium sp.]
MFGLAALLSLITQVSGTPYIPGGDSPAGTDCSGLASWVANVASGRPAFGSRFNTGNIESALLARGFHYGSAPGSVVIGWNSGHAAVTLPDGTPVSSGESGAGVRVGGGGAYQPQFSRHMYLPVQAEQMNIDPPAEPAPVEPVLEPVLAEPPVDLPAEPVLPELPAEPVLGEPVLGEPPLDRPVEPAEPAEPPV